VCAEHIVAEIGGATAIVICKSRFANLSFVLRFVAYGVTAVGFIIVRSGGPTDNPCRENLE
jgi:hypothetical protein